MPTPNAYRFHVPVASPVVETAVTNKETKKDRLTTAAEGVRLALRATHNLAEGAGAAPLAALLNERERNAGKRIGLILTGGNIDRPVLAQILRGETPVA